MISSASFQAAASCWRVGWRLLNALSDSVPQAVSSVIAVTTNTLLPVRIVVRPPSGSLFRLQSLDDRARDVLLDLRHSGLPCRIAIHP